ncbi:Gfo/Idh/MocA family protein [Aggregatilinea lenta]|uniref:Gfo/Idh/MocA family protein n=1 Tax=Aggregatilinea lenta TaxID=913108 RepID=UPI000E5ABE84|nr:Gfo/Idh/MocA family oxidoreductase [Aggregatilinea lenta]
MSDTKRFAVVGTGGRAGMFIQAITDTYRASCELVALCDLSQTRMNWHNQQIQTRWGAAPVPTYHADQFDRMIGDTRPDTVIVVTIDATHHRYINRAMELGCDVITEKPMTTDAEKARSIFDTIDRTGKKLTVTFNYRYAPAFTKLRELLMQGVVGRPLSVDFSWLLDTYHGADYFRRWHREKQNSGGLLVHKATHHFDLVNWWIDSYPDEVFAFGDLLFYGKQNAAARDETYAYDRYTGVPAASEDPFALFLDQDAALQGLYLEAETDNGYIRDRNVFGEPITIEDTMAVTARYRNGVILSYCLVAYSPWEGLKVAITGTKGRVELNVVENVNLVSGQGESRDLQASKGPFKQAGIRVFPMFGEGYDVPFSSANGGGHGGADPILLEQLFSPEPPPDPFNRAASHVDGAASIMLGIAANRAMEINQPVRIDDLFYLPKKADAGVKVVSP